MYNNILVSVDLNETAEARRVLGTAVEYARAFESRLHVLTVVPDYGSWVVGQYFPENFTETAVAEARKQLETLVEAAAPKLSGIEVHVSYGNIYKEILQAVERTQCDLVVMGAHRPELRDYLIGPNAARVVRHANCSVLVVRD